jgi:hypothetical protein
MASRPATTVLLITRNVIARADFARDHALVKLWSQARPDVQEWPMLVEIALGLGPRAGGKVFILSSDLWTQTLTLPNVSTANMSQEELASALNFEAESLSGQSAFESTVAVQTLPASHGYWIVQPRTADFEQADKIIGEAGSRLAGLGHPGGLPFHLSGSDKTASWSRIEFWPDAVLLLRGDSQGQTLVQVLNADPQTGRWKAEWDAWRQQDGGTHLTEALAGPGVIGTVPNVAKAMSLESDSELAAWLTAWVKCLDGKTASVPLLRPAKKPMATALRCVIAAALAALVLVGCWSVYNWLDNSTRAAAAEWKQIDDKNKQLASVQKQVDESKGKQKDLQAQTAGLESSLKVLGTHRHRLARFLTKLRELHPEHLYVEKIDLEAGEPHLFGHCLQPELADQFANQLAQALADQGWEVQSPKKKALKTAVNGAPWSFEIQLKSAKEMTVDTRVEIKKGKGK